MYLDELQGRLLAVLRTRLRNGELTERRLAHLTGISQPHVHNVLKGTRLLSLYATDQMMRRVGLTVQDLIQLKPLADDIRADHEANGCCLEVPVLEGWLGPGLPLPRKTSRSERYPFPRSYLAPVGNAVVARLGPDSRMAGLFFENDLVLLDQSPAKRANLYPGTLYVVSKYGEGLVRRLRLERPDLLLLIGARGDRTEEAEAFPLSGYHLLDVVKARVAWIGRSL